MKSKPLTAPEPRQKKRGYWIALVGVVLLLGLVSFSEFLNGGLNRITTVLQVPSLEGTSTQLRALPSLGAGTQQALFDITVTLPEPTIRSGEGLLISVSLTNVGSEKTDATLIYLVTQQDGGSLVFIEHEQKMVETQDQFLKTLQLQKLPPGKYNLYTHLKYGEFTATASEEFTVSWN